MVMTMMSNIDGFDIDKMTISGRVFSLRGQGGGEGGSRLTFRLVALMRAGVIMMVIVVVVKIVVNLLLIVRMVMTTFVSTLEWTSATYRVSQKKLSLVKISCGKYNSGWWEIQ